MLSGVGEGRWVKPDSVQKCPLQQFLGLVDQGDQQPQGVEGLSVEATHVSRPPRFFCPGKSRLKGVTLGFLFLWGHPPASLLLKVREFGVTTCLGEGP